MATNCVEEGKVSSGSLDLRALAEEGRTLLAGYCGAGDEEREQSVSCNRDEVRED